MIEDIEGQQPNTDVEGPISQRYAVTGKQVELGVVMDLSSEKEILVISEGWPTWLMAMVGSGFKEVKCWAAFESLSSKLEFDATGFNDLLLAQSSVVGWVEDRVDSCIIMIQSSSSFFKQVSNMLDLAEKDIPLLFVCTEPSFLSSDCFRLSHENCGGVTNGEWSVFVENLPEFNLLSTSNSVKRVLHQVINPVQGSLSTRELNNLQEDELAGLANMNERIAWCREKILVKAPSVFHHGELVTRWLSTHELMDAYDIELTVQDALKDYWEKEKTKASLCFVSQVPVKVLSLLTNSLQTSLADKCKLENDSINSYESNATLNIENTTPALPEHSEEDDDESIFGELTLTSDMAARPDDAEADPRDWDVWNVTTFDTSSKPNNQEPLVCTGVYDEVKHDTFFDAFRRLMERKYRMIVRKSFVRYMQRQYGNSWQALMTVGNGSSEFSLDLNAGRDAIARAANSSWWNWDDGSTLYFWRWPSHLRTFIRDGSPLFIDWSAMPNYKRKQQWPSDESSRCKLESKLRKVMKRRYIKDGYVKSLTGFFAVPKADTDIRVVYDATKCGLNDALWAPNFWLPTVDTVLNQASDTTWFSDVDLGEMFLNYPLDPRVRPYAGVDLTELDNANRKFCSRVFARWERMLMGFCPSPYITTQTYAWGEEMIVGNYTDQNNPFFWDQVILNLPGSTNYNPALPWVYKWRSEKKSMPSFMETYIDDVRSGGNSEKDCRFVTHRIASRLNYLGQQDAARKRGQASQTPRAWTGAKCVARSDVGIFAFSTQQKWDKGKAIVNELYEIVVVKKLLVLEFKPLEKGVGFLCHLSRTYPAIFPYLKGLYNTLNSWRIGRNSNGWKISRTAWIELLSGDMAFDEDKNVELPFESRKRKFMEKYGLEEAPLEVKPVPRLSHDLLAINSLLDGEKPSLRLVRGKKFSSTLYGFGDASGDGFGSSWQHHDMKIKYRFGLWGDSMNDSSSNFRELANLVETLEQMGNDNTLAGQEVFLFTDNSTSEAAFFNGSSSSENLFNLMLRMRKLEMTAETKIHLCHVSGERMKAQGTDGLSRGNLTVGVMGGQSMISYVPLHLSALERSSCLEPWLRSWMDDEEVEFLSPNHWYTRGHDHTGVWKTTGDFTDPLAMNYPETKTGIYVWTPAPCAAASAIEELRKARHKRQESMHFVLIPRLMMPHWRKQLFKAADIVLTLPCSHFAWPKTMYEPLTFAIIYPFVHFRPWQLRGSPKLLELGRQLSRVWREDSGREGPLLRELFNFQKTISSMSSQLAWKVLQGIPHQSVPRRPSRKRRGNSLENQKRRRKVLGGKDR